MLTKAQKEQWIAALRSGKWKQGKGSLRIDLPDGSKEYCCQGVACEIFGIDYDLERHSYLLGLDPNDGPLHAAEPNKDGTYLRDAADAVRAVNKTAYMNDQGKSFCEIADWLEINLLSED